ncbi:glycosyltransferase [Patescibacteria group bacterium]|nr:glycosyltransferase [Patescibacteria group bacterium]
MKVALVHDYLTEYGGAERVLEAIHEIWPEAPVFTSLFDENVIAGLVPALNLGDHKGRNYRWDIRPSRMQKFPFVRWLSKQYTFFYPLVFEHFDLREYDVIISDGTIWSKGVLTTPEQLHIHYCHTPARFLYHYGAESSRRDVWYYRPVVKILDHYLRIWDFESAQRPDFIIANSKTVGERVRKFWRREATVIYPPVSLVSEQLRKLSESERQKNQSVRNSDTSDAPTFRRSDAPSYSEFSGNPYFLVVSRLSAYKNIDLAIEACNKLNLPLVIVGTGREEERLKALAGKNIKFMDFVEDQELSKLYKACKALIFPVSDEDFGIVPVEAMSFGKPVIALRSGGVQETVVEGKTGVFFDQPTVESLVAAIERFEGGLKGVKGVKEDCVARAKGFSKERFQQQFREFVENKWKERFKG